MPISFKWLHDLLDVQHRDRIDTGEGLVQQDIPSRFQITRARAISTRRRSPPERA